VAAGQDVLDHEFVAMPDKSEVSEKAPHRPSRIRENGQSHRRGYLSGRRPRSVGTGIRRPPVLIAVHEPPKFPRPGELPQERGHAVGAAGETASIAGDITRRLFSRHWPDRLALKFPSHFVAYNVQKIHNSVACLCAASQLDRKTTCLI
jgi:hypothetical protein